jgi:NAD(P)-dependent dehydrogenase (short-subunit alcohol dehydrogenase family)
MAGRFEGRVALVSSAASGIGAATAEAFAREGAQLVISDIDEAGLKATAERIKAMGSSVQYLVADGTNESQVEATVRKAVDTYGGLHVAANVVGDTTGDAFGPNMHEQSVAGWTGTLALCVTSTFISLKHEIAHMRSHGGGAIVNVSSLAGMRFVQAAGAAYSAGKAAVIQLTKYAALSYADAGIRVNCVSPGATATPVFHRKGKDVGDAYLARMVEYHAIKRPVKASEQAAAILWLCSQDAEMITGLNVPVDGGWAEKS